MTDFDKSQFINNIHNIINRVSNMKDKVKGLQLLDTFQEVSEDKYYLYIYSDNNIWDKFTDLYIKSDEIKRDMTEKELNIYGNSLSNIILEKDWIKKQETINKLRIKEAIEYKINNTK